MSVSIIIAAISGALLLYTYIGYQLITLIAAAVRRKPVSKGEWRGDISVVVVTRNSEGQVAKRIRNLLRQTGLQGSYEVIVALDGSEDTTGEIARSIDDDRLQVISFPENRGKAAVLNDTIPQCKGEIVVLADVRQKFTDSAIKELCENFADSDVGAVSGELVFKREDELEGIGPGFEAYWRVEKVLRKAESATGSVIGCTGAIYAIRKGLYEPLAPETVLDDVAIPMRIALNGKRVVFEPNAAAFDAAEEDPAEESKRKIRTLAGNLQLCRLYPELLSPAKNRLLLAFVSHKLLRLFAPWLMLLLFASTGIASSSSTAMAALFCIQAVFYLLAAVTIPLGRLPIGFLKMPAAFLLLNIWAARAPFHYWSGKLSPKWG